MLKVGYLGPEGTFSQEAMEVCMKSEDYEGIPFAGIPELLQAVAEGVIDEAVVPMENSLEGAVNSTLDMLAWEVDLKIRAELAININQNLLAEKGVKLQDIKYILSHPQPFGQCRRFISTELSSAAVKYTYSTAGAAQEVALGAKDSAAIGSATAARVYGLEILARNIQDEDNNQTRFVVLSRQDADRTGNDKTSIVFSTEDRPGSLYRILDIFNLLDINMTRIESRPAKNQLGRYIFFVDISGHRDDEDVESALALIRRKTSFYKFLGSYPAHGSVES